MKKHLFLILLILSFVACNKTTKEGEPVLELIAYRWQYDEQHQLLANGQWGDTIIEYLENELYTQIYKDGNCFVNKKHVPFKEDIYSNFKMDTAHLNSVLRIFETINSDTVMIDKGGIYCYNGPLIRIIGKDKNNKEITLKFHDTDDSNLDLVNFFRHINSKADSIGSNEKLFHARENRMKEIYNLEIDCIPKPIKSSIQFTVPEIK